MPEINLIAAMTWPNKVIGLNNTMPWPKIPLDLQRFRNRTEGWPVIMGMNTWESIPERFRPLVNRHNVILTRNWIFPSSPQIDYATSLDLALERVAHWDKAWIIGGGQVYKEALERDIIDEMHLTLIQTEFEGDVFFPEFNHDDWKWTQTGYMDSSHLGFEYAFFTLKNRRRL